MILTLLFLKVADELSLFGFPDIEDVQNPFLSGTKLPIAAKKGMNF